MRTLAYIFFALSVLFFLVSCSDSSVNNANQTSTDSIAIKAIDSSIIMNDSTKLPDDSTTTGVTH
jgi:hypothetical protein